jgi:VanZ family protein
MRILSSPRFTLTVRFVFWIALVFAVVMAVLPQPPYTPIDSYGDKFAHMLAFAVLMLLGALGFPAASRWRVAERLSFLGAIIEVVQSIPVLGRDCDIRDWIADTLAILVVMGLVELGRRLADRRARAGQ